MIQYLINSAFIWTVSLLFYFLFLRKETFFQWNRIYLLGTGMLGIVVSFYKFKAPLPTAESNSLKYLNQVVSAKEEIMQPAVSSHVTIGIETILWIIYFTGCIVTLIIYCRELVKIYMIYRQGCTYYFQQWKIVETNLSHTPFSWRSILFITAKDNYSSEEFDIISSHESIHCSKYHFLDIIFLTILQIVFWFNPLVYIYKYLIKLTHEFEADSHKTQNTEIYGKFLIEQALKNFRPALLHTFSSSPLKNRIMMLTQKKSNSLKALKYLAIIPILMLSFVVVTYAQKKLPVRKDLGNGKFEYMGNVFEKKVIGSNYNNDTAEIKSPAGEIHSVIILRAEGPPNIFNGKMVYDSPHDNCTKPEIKNGHKNLSVYLFNLYKSDFEKLPDNEYQIYSKNFIIDENGKVVLMDDLSISKPSVSMFSNLDKGKVISAETRAELEKLSEKMNITMLYNTPFIPSILNGSHVPAYYWEGSAGRKKIIVRNGKATIVDNDD